MRHLDLDVFEPGETVATVSHDGRVFLHVVGPNGELTGASGGVLGDGFDIDDTIETLDLSVRAYNVLKRENVNTVGQLLDVYDSKGPEGMMNDFRNLGLKATDEITTKIRQLRGLA